MVAGVRRELREEAGIEATSLRLRGTISWPGFGAGGEDWFGTGQRDRELVRLSAEVARAIAENSALLDRLHESGEAFLERAARAGPS